MTHRKKWDIKKILSDEKLREDLIVQTIIATQAREGIKTTEEQARLAYRKARERSNE